MVTSDDHDGCLSYGNSIQRKPMAYMAPMIAALDQSMKARPDLIMERGTRYMIGFEGEFGRNRVSPRELLASHVASLMCVEGIVTRCSQVRPKVIRSVHYCEATKKHSDLAYHDETSVTGFPTSSAFPTKVLIDIHLQDIFVLEMVRRIILNIG
jgi:DNA replication licensing factor MCM3